MDVRSECLVRHPAEMPLELSLLGHESCRRAELGQLLIQYDSPVATGSEIRIRLPKLDHEAVIDGQVIWRVQMEHGYLLGIAFHSEGELFRMRMLEQLCYIMLYRQSIYRQAGRWLTLDEAAEEWIKRFSKEFPEADITCH